METKQQKTLKDAKTATQAAEAASLQNKEVGEGSAEAAQKVVPAPVSEEGEEMMKESEIDKLVAQAEERGYLRGRNESIDELMRRPGMMEREPWSRACEQAAESEPMILNNLKVSIWDR